MSQDLITFRCPKCQAPLSLPASMPGAKGPCLYCNTEIIGPIPELSEPARLASARAFEPPSAVPPAPEPIPPLSANAPAARAEAAPPLWSEPAIPYDPFPRVEAPAMGTATAPAPSPQPAGAPFPLAEEPWQPFPPLHASAAPEPVFPPAAAAPYPPQAPQAPQAAPSPSFDWSRPSPPLRETAPPAAAMESAYPFPGMESPQAGSFIDAQPASRLPASASVGPDAPWQARGTETAFPFAEPSAEPFGERPRFTNTVPSADLWPARDTGPAPRPAEPAQPFPQQRAFPASTAEWAPPPQTQPFPYPDPQPPYPYSQPQPYPFSQQQPREPQPAPFPGAQMGPHYGQPQDQAPFFSDPFSTTTTATAFPETRRETRSGSKRVLTIVVSAGIALLVLLLAAYLWIDFNKLVPTDPGTAATKGPGSGSGQAETPPPVVDTPPTPPSAIDTAPLPTTTEMPAPIAPAQPPDALPGAKPDIVDDTPPATTAAATPAPPPPTSEPVAGAAEPGSLGNEVDPERTTDTTGLLDLPIKALQNFLNASSWQKRVDHSLRPEKVRPLMESYYRERPDGAVVPTSMRFQHSETDPETNRRFYVFHLTTETAPDGFPVLIEEADNGLKVDWETFVEFKDNLFHEFASKPATGKTGTFHLIMRNAHYFGENFPELTELTPYRLDPPIPDQESYAFAKTDSLVNQELQKHVSWGMNFTPFLELRWAKSQKGSDYLQVVRLLHTNWRNREP